MTRPISSKIFISNLMFRYLELLNIYLIKGPSLDYINFVLINSILILNNFLLFVQKRGLSRTSQEPLPVVVLAGYPVAVISADNLIGRNQTGLISNVANHKVRKACHCAVNCVLGQLAAKFGIKRVSSTRSN